jgi:phosphoglycolate phosphatase
MIRCVVFDFDGTLVDSNDLKRQGFVDIARERSPGSEPMMEQSLRAMTGGRRAVFEDYVRRLAATGKCLDADELTSQYSRQVDQKVSIAAEMPGASGLLQSLREQQYAIYLSSATPLENLLRVLAWRSWSNRFDGIFGLPQTKPETLMGILDTKRLDPWQVVVIGDGQDDGQSAHLVGCRFIPVGLGSYVPQGEETPAIQLSQVDERLRQLRAQDACR